MRAGMRFAQANVVDREHGRNTVQNAMEVFINPQNSSLVETNLVQ